MHYYIESIRLKLTTVGDNNTSLGRAGLAALSLHLLDDVHAFNNAAKDSVLAVEPRGHDGGDEELRAVGLGDVSKRRTEDKG